MNLQSTFTRKSPVKIHYIRTGDISTGLTPVVMVPGFSGIADHFKDEMKFLLPRPSLALSFRGRGYSDAPTEGPEQYSLEKHVEDLEHVLFEVGWKKMVLFAYSAGVPISIQFSLKHPELVKGLIIADYPPETLIFSDEKQQEYVKNPPFGMDAPTLQLLFQAQKKLSFHSELNQLKCPLILYQGKQQGSLLKDSDLESYKKASAPVRVVGFEQSSHDLRQPDFQSYILTLQNNLQELDGQ